MQTDRFNSVIHSNRKPSIPRIPSLSEKTELLSLLLDNATTELYDFDEEEVINANALIDSASIAVYGSYATDSRSGYTGKLMAVVWSTDPAAHEVFIWRNGMLQQTGRFQDG
jgi:hypothetical protein